MGIKFFTRLFIELRGTRCVGNEDFAELQKWVNRLSHTVIIEKDDDQG